VLLHGFPEFWWSWRFQFPALVDAGFQVIAPDMRGYNTSEKPRHVADYAIPHLVADIRGLVRALGHDKVDLVAHDWGGAVAWNVAALAPDVVDRLAVLNCPHPTVFARGLRNPKQLRMSWYMAAFQLPFLPEQILVRRDTMTKTFRGWSTRPEHFDDDVIARFREAISQEGAARSAINYYRAARGDFAGAGTKLPRIAAKTLLVWGEEDQALGPWLVEPHRNVVDDLRIERISGASHWVQQDAPERVNELLLEFLRR